MKFIKELVILDSLIIICERWLHQHASPMDLLQCNDDMHHQWTLTVVWCLHASPVDLLQYDDDMHHRQTHCSVMMTCITNALAAVWWWHASLIDSLQCDDNMHHYGTNIIKGLATSFLLPAGTSLGRYFQTHLFCYGNNRPGGGSLSATLDF